LKATTATWHIERRSLRQKRTRQPDCDSGFKQPKLDPIYGSRQNRASSSSVGMSNEEVSFVPSDEWPAEAGDSEVSELCCPALFTSGRARSARPAVLRLLCGFRVCIYICASALITCAIITSRTLLPCDLTMY